jgi:Cu(I)/Ag(I) efflux system membrane fusion protein
MFTACDRNKAMQDATSQTTDAKANKDIASSKANVTDALYVCPMHPHIQQHGPGTCPICGMTLQKKDMPTSPAADKSDKGINNPTPSSDRRILYYYDPMRPEVHFDKPGQSPYMNMELVPKYDETSAETGIEVSNSVIQSLGIRTASPVKRDVRSSVRAPARVVSDAHGQVRLQSRVNGWIEHLKVRAAGQKVSAGSVVAEIYAPELIQAQEEMLLGAETAGPATERLRRFGIAEVDIQAIRRAGKSLRRIPLRAPINGVVTELGVREGSSVSIDTIIVEITTSDAVWIEAQLFPAQLVELGHGLSGRFTLYGASGHSWISGTGTVLPIVDPVTQTIPVRFAANQADGLVLGIQLDAVIEGETRLNVLLVPVSAVIRTARGDRVLRMRSKTRFEPVTVKLGKRYGQEIEILSGLLQSDRIVTSGQFLLDAEANLQAGFALMGTGEGDGDMEMTP